ncbi:hypothetical protein AB0F59_33850 [Micromonospora lupini]|uniref:hypothetical protein n=1 Tax=Micromonospora lupini TaxID=285679 RepID=UPI0033E1B49F
MAVQWETLAASAAVAAAVSVITELTAKPWLEVRKERALRKYRARSDALADMQSLLGQLNALHFWAKYRVKTDVELLTAIVAAEESASKFLHFDVDRLPAFTLAVNSVLVMGLANVQATCGFLQEDYRDLKRKNYKGKRKDFAELVEGEIFECILVLEIPFRYSDTRVINFTERRWLNREATYIAEHPEERLEALLTFGRKYSRRRELNPEAPRAKLSDVRRW